MKYVQITAKSKVETKIMKARKLIKIKESNETEKKQDQRF